MAERCQRAPSVPGRPDHLLTDYNQWAKRNRAEQANLNRFRFWAERQPGFCYKKVNGSDCLQGLALRMGT